MKTDVIHSSALLGQSTRTVTLPGGLTVQMCRMPGFVTAYAMLTVGVGSIDTGYRLLGVGGMIVFPITAMLLKQIWDHSGLQPEG